MSSPVSEVPLLRSRTERLVWAAIVQLFSFVGIDVIHYKDYILLRKVIKAPVPAVFSFKKAPDQFVVYFDGAFLIRTPRVTVKNSGADHTSFFVTLDGNRVGELTPVVTIIDGLVGLIV